jgi:hypothetical protein
MLLTGRAYRSAGHVERASGAKVWLTVGPVARRLSLVTGPHHAASQEGGNTTPLTRLAHLSAPRIGGGLRGSKGKNRSNWWFWAQQWDFSFFFLYFHFPITSPFYFESQI